MSRWLVVVVLLGILGCARQELTDVVVHAGSAAEFTSFRASLGARFGQEQLQSFDTALQELRLDAMHRDVAPAAAREDDMQQAVDGKTLRAVEILGWQARRARLLREIVLMSDLLERDLKRQQQSATTGTPQSVLTHIENERAILARLQAQLTATDQQLAAWESTSR